MRKQSETRLYEYGINVAIDFIILTREHKELAKKFKCNNQYIDKYIWTGSYKEKDAVTYAAIDTDKQLIVSILTLVATGVYTAPSILSLRPETVIPAIEIKNFATDIKYQALPYNNQKESKSLSYQIFNKYLKGIGELSQTEIGIKHIVLYSVDFAVKFYSKFGFHEFKHYMVGDKKDAIRRCTPMYFNLN